MSTSPFMDDYSSEDYSDHDDDYYFVPTATSPPQVGEHVEIQTQTQRNELENLIIDQQESVYFDVLPELEAEMIEEEEEEFEGGGMEQSVYLAVESYFGVEAQAEIPSETGVVAAAAFEAETVVEELAVGAYFELEAEAETGVVVAAFEAELLVEELAVKSHFDLEAEAETSVVAAAFEAELVVEELAVKSHFDHEAQVENGVVETVVVSALEAETVAEELAVGACFDHEAQVETGVVASAFEAELVAEELAVKTYFDLEAQVETGGVAAAAFEAELVVEELTVGACFDHEPQVETGVAAAAFEAETVVEEGDVIDSESKLESVEAGTEVDTVERNFEEFSYEAVESESDLEAGDAIEEPDSDVEHEADAVADAVAPEAETAVGEGDVMEELPETVAADVVLNPDTAVEVGAVIGEPIYEAVESAEEFEPEDDHDLIDDDGDNQSYSFEEAWDSEEEEEEEHDVIDEPQEFDYNLQADPEAQALLEEGAAMEASPYEPLPWNLDLQVLEEPEEALAAPAVSFDMITFIAQEPEDADADLIADQSYSFEETRDSEEEEEGEDDVVVPYLISSIPFLCGAWEYSAPTSSSSSWLPVVLESTACVDSPLQQTYVPYFISSIPFRCGAWEYSVPTSSSSSWLPVLETTACTTACVDSPLQESYVGCSPMLMLQECGYAVMQVIETLLCELARIRNDLRRAFGALIRKRETTKRA